MPNSSLYGKEYSVPGNVLNALRQSGSQRSGNIVDKGKISYSLLKRLKNDFDYLKPGSGEYEQYGGDIVKNWVNEILRNNRSDVHDIKKNQMDTGMFNRFKKEHSKDKNKNPTQPSGIDVGHKEFMRENKKVVRLTESELRLIIEKEVGKYTESGSDWKEDFEEYIQRIKGLSQGISKSFEAIDDIEFDENTKQNFINDIKTLRDLSDRMISKLN